MISEITAVARICMLVEEEELPSLEDSLSLFHHPSKKIRIKGAKQIAAYMIRYVAMEDESG